MATEKPIAAYKGSEPYTFVCYSHADEVVVYPELEWLHERGARLWYDEGISAGRAWRSEIAEAIDHAQKILLCISPSMLNSEHCSREINYAIDQGKDIVPLYLERVDLTPDLRVGINRIQALFLDDSHSHRKALLQALVRKSDTNGRGLGNRLFQVGEFVVNPVSNSLTHRKDVKEIQPKTMQLLVFLAEHSGRLVTADQIMRGVWGDVIITEDSIYQHIRRLRSHLGDDTKSPRYIQTVPRRGYRLLESANPIDQDVPVGRAVVQSRGADGSSSHSGTDHRSKLADH